MKKRNSREGKEINEAISIIILYYNYKWAFIYIS